MAVEFAFWLAPAGAILALVFAYLFYKEIVAAAPGDDDMRRIAGYVREGAFAYLKRQYVVVGVVFAVLVVYLSLSHFYSLIGKQVVILDILLIAAGFVLRAVAGALAIQVPYSDWFVLCTLFVALFIALSKRRAELRSVGDGAGSRPVLALYTDASLTAFTITSMAGAVISYSLYVQDVVAATSVSLRRLIFTVPFVILAIFRYYLLVDRDEAGERPEEVLLTDRPLQACIAGFGIVAVLAFYGS